MSISSYDEAMRRLRVERARPQAAAKLRGRKWSTSPRALRDFRALPDGDRAAAIKVLAHAIDLRARNGLPESAGLAALMRIAKGEG